MISIKRIGIFSLILFILGSIILYLVHKYFFYERLCNHILDSLEKATNRKVTISRLGKWKLNGFSIWGLVIHDREGFNDIPLFRVDILNVNHDLLSIFRKGSGGFELRFIKPELNIKKRKGELNIKDILAEKHYIDPIFSLLILFPRILNEDLRVSFEQDGRKWEIKGLSIDIFRKKERENYGINIKSTGEEGRPGIELDALMKIFNDSAKAEGRFKIVSIPIAEFKGILLGNPFSFKQGKSMDAEGSFRLSLSRKIGVTGLEVFPFKAKLSKGIIDGRVFLSKEERDKAKIAFFLKNIDIYPFKEFKLKGLLEVTSLFSEGGVRFQGGLKVIDCNSPLLNSKGMRLEELNGDTSFDIIFFKEKGVLKIESISVSLSCGFEGNGKGEIVLSGLKDKEASVKNASVFLRIKDLKALSKVFKGLPVQMEGEVKLSGRILSFDHSYIGFDGNLDLNDFCAFLKDKGLSIYSLKGSIPVRESIPVRKGVVEFPFKGGNGKPWGWFQAYGIDHGLFKLRKINGGIRIERRSIEINGATYDLYMGKGEGSAKISYSRNRPFLEVMTSFNGSSLNEFCKANGMDGIKLSGLVMGNMNIKINPPAREEIDANIEVEEPGGSLKLSFLEKIKGGSKYLEGITSLGDISNVQFRRAKAKFYTTDKGLLLDIALYRLKFGFLFGLNLKEMEIRNIPIQRLKMALRGNG
jgi:hypothetical protein